VPDHKRAITEFRVADNRAHFPCPQGRRVLRPLVAVAHAAEVERGNPELRGEKWRNEAPPVCMRAATVDEKDAPVGR
jgi:hypothetical protein